MRYRKLDKNGDFSAGHGSADFFVDSPEAVGQSVLTRLRLWTGEWFLNTDEGTPYREQVLGAHRRQSAGPAIKMRVAGTEGVTSVDAFNADYDGDSRHIAVAATISTVYGETQIEGVI